MSETNNTPKKVGDKKLQTKLHIRNAAIAASVCALLTINTSAVRADDTDLSGTPTLDRLNAEGALIPGTSQVYPESAYTLTKVDSPTAGKTITKYEINPDTNQVTPVYYNVSLKRTEYGDKDNHTDVLYFKWENNKLVQTSNESEKALTYYINNTRPDSSHIDTNQNGADIDMNFKDLHGDYNGGAIKNDQNYSIGNITGTFIGNGYQNERYSESRGGAIYNKGSITSIKGDFVNNYMQSGTASQYRTQGGAIYNSYYGVIGDITGSFIGNYAKNDSTVGNSAYGGAIYNSSTGYNGEPDGKINSITGDFIGNYAESVKGDAYGGAISNYGIIGTLTANFIGNYSLASNGAALGGAVYNDDTIGKVTGDFIGNYASGRRARGGAVFNDYSGTMDNVTGDFIGNYASGQFAEGGAVYNFGKMEGITGDFLGNYAEGTIDASGGAIFNGRAYNPGTMGAVKGNFAENYVKAGETATGGAIYNSYYGSISEITGDFIKNSSVTLDSADTLAAGGAIYNMRKYDDLGSIDVITGRFINNYASASGDNSKAYGGAVYNNAQIGEIVNSLFDSNYVQADGAGSVAQGGAIYNASYQKNIISTASQEVLYYTEHTTDADGNILKTMYTIDGMTDAEFIELLKSGNPYHLVSDGEGNYTLQDQYDWAGVDNLADLIAFMEGEGYTQANPEDLYNDNYVPPVVSIDTIRNLTALTLKNTSLINNHADSENGEAKGGAIYSEGNIKMSADNGKTTFISGNYTKNGDVIDQNAIYMKGYNLIFDSTNASTIQVDDKIDGENYGFYIIGDNTSKVILNNNVDNAKITLMETNLILGKDEVLNGSESLTLNSGMLSMVNDSAGTLRIPEFTLNGNTNFASDVNLENKTMDRISADTYKVNTAATLNVNYLNLLNDAAQSETRILFADADLKNNVAYTGISPVAYSPIYKYDVSYLKDSGEFLFSCPAIGGGSTPGGNPSDNFNPGVLPTPVNSQAGGYTTQLQTFNYAFQHSDTFMQIPAAQRFAIKNQNKYALSPTGDATDVGVFSPLLTKYETGGIWFKPYASFENIPLKNGPKVNNINYGTLVGFDSNLKSIKHGWERVLTGYIGYNGATQNFSGVTSNQNGGILGTTATFYKGNFFNATTLSVGATAGTNNTMYGSEDYTMLLAGIADKFGYNFEFKEGKYIIQPSMLMSYSFVNTFDYRNAAGVNIQSDPLNALQLAPGIKFIMNTKNGWQPYIGVNMVWNIMDQTKVKANDVRLPSMSIDPYIEYGVGVQRKWGERFMGYAQAMVHNGGRNGISLNGGFRWAIGKK